MNDRATLWAVPRKDSPFPGATTLRFYYETTVDGAPWLADVEEEQMFEPETFEVDPDPCGAGFRDREEMTTSLRQREARQVGYVEDGRLFITEDIRIEAGWGGPPGTFELLPTKFETIRANVRPELQTAPRTP
jgi:hypothetical protein